MLCQSCQKRQANTHIKTVVNGELTEMSLCSACAEKMGYGNVFSHMFDLGSLMSGFMGEPKTSALAPEEKCPMCGSTFYAISKSGKVGCAECYNVFYDKLLPSIKRIHGNTVHAGKRAGDSASHKLPAHSAQTPKDELTALKEQLQESVKKQEFERAAQLRDKIKELEQGGKQ